MIEKIRELYKNQQKNDIKIKEKDTTCKCGSNKDS